MWGGFEGFRDPHSASSVLEGWAVLDNVCRAFSLSGLRG